MIHEIAVVVISSKEAAEVCTAPPTREANSRSTVIQEQTTAESFLNITYTPLFLSLLKAYTAVIAASLYGNQTESGHCAAIQTISMQGNDETDRTDSLQQGALSCKTNRWRKQPVCFGSLSVSIACTSKEAGSLRFTAEIRFHFCTVLKSLYHICNRFARLFQNFFPFFIKKVQWEIQKMRQSCIKNTKNTSVFTELLSLLSTGHDKIRLADTGEAARLLEISPALSCSQSFTQIV
jgi:hypothetical protein